MKTSALAALVLLAATVSGAPFFHTGKAVIEPERQAPPGRREALPAPVPGIKPEGRPPPGRREALPKIKIGREALPEPVPRTGIKPEGRPPPGRREALPAVERAKIEPDSGRGAPGRREALPGQRGTQGW